MITKKSNESSERELTRTFVTNTNEGKMAK